MLFPACVHHGASPALPSRPQPVPPWQGFLAALNEPRTAHLEEADKQVRLACWCLRGLAVAVWRAVGQKQDWLLSMNESQLPSLAALAPRA